MKPYENACLSKTSLAVCLLLSEIELSLIPMLINVILAADIQR